MLLRVPTTNTSSFVVRQRSVGVKLVTKNPLTRNNISTRRTWDERPCVVKKEGIIFIFHGLEPVGIKKGGFIGLRDWGYGVGRG